MRITHLVTLAALVLSPGAFAAQPTLSIQGGVGLMGLSAGAAWHFNPYLAVGGTFNGYSQSGNRDYHGVNYAYGLHLSSVVLFGNWYPFAGGWHLTLGLVQNSNRINATGVPENGSYTFNGNTYPAVEVGAASAELGFPKHAEYLGMGWGGNGRWGFIFDLGAMHYASPSFNLGVAGAAQNAQLASDVNAYQAKVQADVNSFTWYPQAALSLYVTF